MQPGASFQQPGCLVLRTFSHGSLLYAARRRSPSTTPYVHPSPRSGRKNMDLLLRRAISCMLRLSRRSMISVADTPRTQHCLLKRSSTASAREAAHAQSQSRRCQSLFCSRGKTPCGSDKDVAGRVVRPSLQTKSPPLSRALPSMSVMRVLHSHLNLARVAEENFGATLARSILSVVYKVHLGQRARFRSGLAGRCAFFRTGFTSTSLSAQAVTQAGEDGCGRGAISGAHKDNELRVLTLTMI